jgi:hypothetical protein
MPVKLSTTIKNIASIPNPTNAILARDFSEYMKSVGLSEHFQNGNLKIVIYFAKHIGPDLDFYRPVSWVLIQYSTNDHIRLLILLVCGNI